MTAKWNFRPLPPDITIREPIAGAFFASDAVSDPGSALIRESIQNSLDAAIAGESLLVRISLFDRGNALVRNDVLPYITDAQSHYSAPDNGLRSEDLPSDGEECSAIVFEEFGTSGLKGDPGASRPPRDDKKNNFFHFFRAEGRSDKDSSNRGSWGVGKDAFYRASRINTIFALTVRADDFRALLMGKTILKSHYVGDEYCQDGFFGVLPEENQRLVLPIEDSGKILEFTKIFQLERKDDTGLSVVIPWPDTEINESAVIQAVFRNYFYSIISGSLKVKVETSGVQTLLDQETILSESRKYTDEQGLLPIIELAEWVLKETPECHVINEPDTRRAPEWGKELFPEGLVNSLREKFENGEKIAIKVPLTFRKRDGSRLASHFHVYLAKDNTNTRRRPTFIRDGILISDARPPALQGLRALVIAEDKPLSEFLRLAENPSHTVWQAQQLKPHYLAWAATLRFVRNSVGEIYNLMMKEDSGEDRFILSDFFPHPRQRRESPPPRPRYCRITRADQGFAVIPGKNRMPENGLLRIEVAYDTRHGSAKGRHSIEDFQLGQHPIKIRTDGAEEAEVTSNSLLVRVLEPDKFRIVVTGFDQNRQLYIYADRLEA